MKANPEAGTFVTEEPMETPVVIQADATAGDPALDAQIIWTMIDNPDDAISSGTPIPATSPQIGGTMTYTFNPPTVPPAAPDGRGGPLSYQIMATIVSGVEFNDKIIITQDNIDTLRQEYIDIIGTRPGPDRRSPPDWDAFDQQTSATYPCLVNRPGNEDGCPRPIFDICEHHDWWIASSIIQYANALDTAYTTGALNVTSGYRCPTRNRTISGAVNLSYHQWGRALDFGQNNSDENCRVAWIGRCMQNAIECILYDSGENRHYCSDFIICGGTSYQGCDNPPVNFTHGHLTW